MKRFLLSMFATGALVTAFAVPAPQKTIKFTQPDGTVIELTVLGDEHGHVTYSEDGKVVINNGGRMEYARFNESGFPVASGIAVGDISSMISNRKAIQTTAEVEKWIGMIEANKEERLKTRDAFRMKQMKRTASENLDSCDNSADNERLVPLNYGRTESAFPVIGEQKGLVVLVEYQDVSFQYGDYDYFNRLLNEEGFSDNGSLGSARDWFVYNSNGLFLPEFDVYGPVLLPNKREYYGENDRYGNDGRPQEMVLDAISILDEEVDFSQYDRDGDGKIDNVFLFYAGIGEHDSGIEKAIWPHSWNFEDFDPSSEYIFDGVKLCQYACTCEYPNGYTRPDGIGTFVHEFSHVMGLPDLYVTTYTGGFTPGAWSVLDKGPYNNDGLTPPNYSSYERCALGWVEMLPLEPGIIELTDFAESNIAYALPTENPDEFFFFENRQLNGNDAFMPGHGMLVWHIDYDKIAWNNNAVNNKSSHQRVDLVEADNRKSEKTRNGDCFPGESNITEFTFTTNPGLKSWNKQSLGVDIANIEETEDGLIRLTVDKRSDNSGVDKVGILADCNKIYYDITGRRVANPTKGIYIVDGKKVLVKE